MSRITDLTASLYVARHCADIHCRKCRARARWTRRKAWRSDKKTARCHTEGK